MSDLLAARTQFAVSLGFHIIFASIGICLPLLMVIAEWLHLRTGDETYLVLAKRWAKGAAILFAIGAVSGTIIAFQLGLLWPGFMKFGGAIIGMPFSMEGFAFFTEAIFLGIYLYGWDKLPERLHLLTGAAVAVSGAVSGIFVVTANAWMNNPSGFALAPDGSVIPGSVDPIAAMFNPGWFQQTLHMTIAAYLATSAAVCGIHGYLLLRNRESVFHLYALRIALGVMAVCAILQPLSGDLSARHIARAQPEKLAALEGQFKNEKGAPLRIGGIPYPSEHETKYALEIPKMLSILAFHDPDAEIKGVESWPEVERPDTVVVHFAFQIMVGCGSALLGVSLLALFLSWRKKPLRDQTWTLRLLALCTPLGFAAVEAGWTVTECGRQPWALYRVVKTAACVTPVPHLIVPFVAFGALYIFLSIAVVLLLKCQIVMTDGPNAMDRIRRDDAEEAAHASH